MRRRYHGSTKGFIWIILVATILYALVGGSFLLFSLPLLHDQQKENNQDAPLLQSTTKTAAAATTTMTTKKPAFLFGSSSQILYVIDAREIPSWQFHTLRNKYQYVPHLFVVHDNDEYNSVVDSNNNILPTPRNWNDQTVWNMVHRTIQQQQPLSNSFDWIVQIDGNTNGDVWKLSSHLASHYTDDKGVSRPVMLVPLQQQQQQQLSTTSSSLYCTPPCIVNRELSILLANNTKDKRNNPPQEEEEQVVMMIGRKVVDLISSNPPHECHGSPTHNNNLLLLRQCQDWFPIINTTTATMTTRANQTMHYHHTTFVTVFFPMPSKHSITSYHLWMETMLSIQDPVIIFVPDEYRERIQNLRRHANNRTLILPLNRALETILPVASRYNNNNSNFWQRQLERDPEREKHKDFRLFWIWLSKSWFVMESIRLNPFRSKIFVWCDIGSFRFDTDYLKWRGKQILQHPEVVPRHSMLQMASTSNVRVGDLWLHDKHKGTLFHAGSQTVGYYDTWKVWHDELQLTLHQFVLRDYFIGEDQLIMQHTCLRALALCLYVNPKEVPNEDSYFGLKRILYEGGRDHQYQILPALELSKDEYVNNNTSSSYIVNVTHPVQNKTLQRRALKAGRPLLNNHSFEYIPRTRYDRSIEQAQQQLPVK